MERIRVRMPSPEGVTAGATALAKLPIGRAYHALFIKYAGITLAQMTEIRVKANGKVFQRFSATDLDAMNQFSGMAAASGILTLPFDRNDLKTRAAEEETLVNTGSRGENGQAITSFEIEIDLDAAATAPVITLMAEQSAARAGGIGSILHCVPYTRSAAGAGELQVSDIPFGDSTRVLLSRTFIKAAKLDYLKIEKDTYNIFESDKALNDWIQSNGVRKPKTGWYVFDTTERGYGGAMVDLRGVRDFRYICDMTGAEQLTFYPQFIGALGQ